MSLKAKIEAVIYASEEPVTLAQLVGLLGEEGQAELENLRSLQTSLALDAAAAPEANDPDVLNSEILEPEISEAEPVTEPETTPDAASDGEFEAVAEKKLAREATVQSKARERALRDYFRSLLDQLMSDYLSSDRGLEIREVAGGYRLATKPEYHDAVRGFVKSLKPPLKLTLQALETLAVVAYKQPVTSPEVSEIRGVDSGGVLGGLLARKLVTTAGRKQVIGRPILYKTTKDFLVRFGLKDINELPSIEEFEKMAGELADIEPVQEEIPMSAIPDEASDEIKAPPQSLDETDSAPGDTTTLHDTPEEMLSDKSAAPEGHQAEPRMPHQTDPRGDVSEPQGDGDSTPTDEEIEQSS